MTTPLHFRCPPDILEAIDARAKADSAGRSAVIIKALRAGLGMTIIPSEDTRLPARVAQLEAQLAAVIVQVAELLQAPSPTLDTPAPVFDPIDQAAVRDAINQLDEPEPQASNVVDGQTSIFDALPQQDSDAEPAQALDTSALVEGWLTRREAFEALGGNPDDEASTVASLDGKRAIGFRTFNLPKTKHAAYGVEFSRERMDADQPCMRLIAAKRNAEG